MAGLLLVILPTEDVITVARYRKAEDEFIEFKGNEKITITNLIQVSHVFQFALKNDLYISDYMMS